VTVTTGAQVGANETEEDSRGPKERGEDLTAETRKQIDKYFVDQV
jgi:hypothetical protein